MEQTIKELARFLNISMDEAVRRTVGRNNDVLLRDEWNTLNPQTKEEVLDYYRNTEYYLYALIPWNHSEVFHKRIEGLLHYRNKRILEIGSGNGSLSISLALNGNQVTCHEINTWNREFAKQRISDRLLPIQQVDSLTGLRDFDIIVAIDVLEHIHPDELAQLFRDCYHILRDGGFIYHVTNFSQENGMCPMHFDHAGEIARIAQDAGFTIRANGDYMKGGETQGVQIGLITNRVGVPVPIVQSFMELEAPRGTILSSIKGKPADIARNAIVKALKKDWLFFIDDDTRVPPGALRRLLSWNVDVISGLVFKRTGEPVPMFYTYEYEEGHGEHEFGHWYKPMCQPVGEYLAKHKDVWKDSESESMLLPAHGLLECDGVGAGCLLVNRRVFDAIGDIPFMWDMNLTSGEDFHFCRRVQEAGFKIYGDPSVVCGHYGEYWRSIRHFWAWAMKEEFPWNLEK